MAEQVTITKEDALRALREAVAEKGAEYVYELENDLDSCKYVKDGEASCLVGNALHRLGVPIEVLTELDYAYLGNTSATIDQTAALDVLMAHSVTLSSEAVTALQNAQRSQDRTDTWGKALRAAEYSA